MGLAPNPREVILVSKSSPGVRVGESRTKEDGPSESVVNKAKSHRQRLLIIIRSLDKSHSSCRLCANQHGPLCTYPTWNKNRQFTLNSYHVHTGSVVSQRIGVLKPVLHLLSHVLWDASLLSTNTNDKGGTQPV